MAPQWRLTPSLRGHACYGVCFAPNQGNFAVLTTKYVKFNTKLVVWNSLRSMGERVGTQLKSDDERARHCLRRGAGRAGSRCVDPLDVERRAIARGHP